MNSASFAHNDMHGPYIVSTIASAHLRGDVGGRLSASAASERSLQLESGELTRIIQAVLSCFLFFIVMSGLGYILVFILVHILGCVAEENGNDGHNGNNTGSRRNRQLRPWERLPSFLISEPTAPPVNDMAQMIQKNLIVEEWIADDAILPGRKISKYPGRKPIVTSKTKLKRQSTNISLPEQERRIDNGNENSFNNRENLSPNNTQDKIGKKDEADNNNNEDNNNLDDDIQEPIHEHVFSDLGCAICMKCYVTGDIVCESNNFACEHMFHYDCITLWLPRNNCCPICRETYVLPTV